MPPPNRVEAQLGEKRLVAYQPIGLAFGKEVEMEHFPHSEQLDKRAKRAARAEYLTDSVKADYSKISHLK